MDSIAIARELRFSRAKREFSSVDSSLVLQIYRVLREVRRVATVRRSRLSGGQLARAYGFPFRSFATRNEAFLGPLHARSYHQVLRFWIARSTHTGSIRDPRCLPATSSENSLYADRVTLCLSIMRFQIDAGILENCEQRA